MTEVIWENNEQFDFDYLLKLTNQDFCDAVANFIEKSNERNDFVKTIKVDDSFGIVEVFIVLRHGLQAFNYFKHTKTQNESFISFVDLTWALEVINK